MLLVVIISLLGGFFSSAIAGSKNRSPIAWFIIGALLPLPGIILAKVLPPIRPALEAPQH